MKTIEYSDMWRIWVLHIVKILTRFCWPLSNREGRPERQGLNAAGLGKMHGRTYLKKCQNGNFLISVFLKGDDVRYLISSEMEES